jgi:hypothetical protein
MAVTMPLAKAVETKRPAAKPAPKAAAAPIAAVVLIPTPVPIAKAA